MNFPTEVYRCFDADDHLLYIGMTCMPTERMRQHRRTSPWFQQVARVDLETYPSRGAAKDAEREAIRSERPRHNKQVPSLPALPPMRFTRHDLDAVLVPVEPDGLLAAAAPEGEQ